MYVPHSPSASGAVLHPRSARLALAHPQPLCLSALHRSFSGSTVMEDGQILRLVVSGTHHSQ